MFVVGDRVVCGATDLERGARCEFALLRALDAELGTVPGGGGGAAANTGFGEYGVPPATAPGESRFAALRETVLRRHGAGVVELAPPADPADPLGALATAHSASVAAVRGGAPAVLGAVFFDGGFFTHVDLATRTPDGLRLHGATRARPVPTALRLGAAAEFLESLPVPVDPRLHIHAGDTTHLAEVADAQAVYRARRRRIQQILDEHSTELLPVQWGDPRFRACGRCVVCAAARAEARDLLLVAGMDPATRAALRAAGITTIDRLTTRIATPPEVPAHTLARLRTQAVVQLRQEHSGRGELLPADSAALGMLPPATPGDLALHIHPVAPDRVRVVVAARESVRLSCELPIESPVDGLSPQHRKARRDSARRAFSDLLAALTEPLLADPGLHIFHYTTAGRTLLLHTAGHLGAGEETVDTLLRTGVLVDLYPIVRGAFVLGARSYALDQVTATLGRAGETDGRAALWLADRLRKEAGTAAPRPPDTRSGTLDRLLRETPAVCSSSTEAALTEYAGRTRTAPERPPGTDPHRVAALTAALLGYHRREQQTSWWAHIDRLTHPLSEWAPDPGVMVADSCAVDTNWHIGPGDTVRRFLRLRGRLTGPGLAPGTRVYVVYEADRHASLAIRTVDPATVLGCAVEPDLTDTVRLEETLAPGAAAHDELPIALAPALPGPPAADAQALEEIGEQLLVTLPGLPGTPIFDVLARRPPRMRTPRTGARADAPAPAPQTTTGIPPGPPTGSGTPDPNTGASDSRPLSTSATARPAHTPGTDSHTAPATAAGSPPATTGIGTRTPATTDAASLHDCEPAAESPSSTPSPDESGRATTRPTGYHPPTRHPADSDSPVTGTPAADTGAPTAHTSGSTPPHVPDPQAQPGTTARSADRTTGPRAHLSAPEFPARRPNSLVSAGPELPAQDEPVATTPVAGRQDSARPGGGIPGPGAHEVVDPRDAISAGPSAAPDSAAAITTALRALDRSYLAVQAPTGTGRTAVLAAAIAALVTGDNWRIGIVAPTAVPVENLLDAIVRAGVLPELVAKSDAVAVAPEWLVLDSARYSRFLSNAIRGCVLGGTPGDFIDPARVPRDALDLLVIADANAFPLATAAAVSVSARNLLLAGDPTERHRPGPGPHPEPVDIPVLTWLAAGRRTLPATHGYFLGRTHRMHPRVSDPVSRLFFDNRLRAVPVPPDPETTLEPGIATVLVAHHGNSTSSDAEAREVLQQIRELLGRTWNDGTGSRQLQPHDIVVVSPHRAQVSLIRTLLSRARIEEVLVGTPELFRGREAAVVLVSPATSTPEDAPGPVGALLSAALVHDTLCRARCRAIIVRSPLLTEFLPETLGELSALADFIRL
ncbi:AAA domain-containing protein [Nocardia flavorosea]|uniref:AAA domain-containing protein n=1 Tax=Nocardia flavorosea TaxID=53429 RepID=UPI002B4B1B9F|nr:AAA domain-containing protein [Nocardia flavorosea]